MLGDEPLRLEMTMGIIAKGGDVRTRIDPSLARFYIFAVIRCGTVSGSDLISSSM